MKNPALLFTVLAALAAPNIAAADDNKDQDVLHIYSSRHYNTDEAFYSNFTDQTGIEVKRVEGKGDALIARLQQEGDMTQADLLITVDAGRLWRAEQAELLQPVTSDILQDRISDHLHNTDNKWFGFSTRARVIFYNKDQLDGTEINSYMQLADPRWKGKICVRSSSNIYNQSLLASMIALHGEEKAKEWARGLKDNLARKPQGGDRDQLRAAAAGVCPIAIANSYYYVAMQQSEKEEDRAVTDKLGVIFPDQGAAGTHINISGAGVTRHADNKEAAVKFLEYLASDEAQRIFSDGNNEYPAVESIEPNSDLKKLGPFQASTLNVSELGKNMLGAMKIFDEIEFP